MRALTNMKFFALILLLCTGLVFSGCASKAKPVEGEVAAASAPAPTPAPEAEKKPWFPLWSGKKKEKTPQAVAPRLIGTIKMVNKEDKFVLIDALSYGSTQPGDEMICIVDQKESARLKAGVLRNPPFLIADIASGNPSPGDKVYMP